MIAGIPYFGDNTQEIYNTIINSNITKELEYDSLYLLVKNYMYKRVVVVIDNEWLTWLNDIVFNYRDKQCYIPYYTYEWFEDNSREYRSNGKGMIVLNDNTIKFRYNYTFKKLDININNLSLILYDLDTNEKLKVSTTNWFKAKNFSVDKLYELYLNSCYSDDTILNKDYVKYIYITNQYKKFKNKELELRKQFDLNNFYCNNRNEPDYRDVRQYKYDEIVQKIGIRDTNDSYNLRRLKFESYLYCILRQECEPIEHLYKNIWNNKLKNNDFIKIGDKIKLIVKQYWFNN